MNRIQTVIVTALLAGAVPLAVQGSILNHRINELETYYIISVGMRYLEEENLESYNIPKMLQEDIHTRKQQVKRRNIFRKSAVFLGVLFIIAALILLLSYLGHLELPELF